jgi:CxxC-x17-CxxC domain-containing protein
MGNFFNDRNSGRRGGGRSERPSMHEAVCDKCGRDCEVPFRPSGDKPIYCSRCFENVSPKRESRDYRGGGSSSYKGGGSSSVDLSPLKEQLSGINSKLETLIEIMTPKEKEVKPKRVVKKAKK